MDIKLLVSQLFNPGDPIKPRSPAPPKMHIPASKNKELMLILSPDLQDRGTEMHFLSLFEKPLVAVIPPKFLLEGEHNPVPHKDSVLLFEGGTDINPTLYKQELGTRTQQPDTQRDVHEQHYFDLAQAVGASCIGVCRGAQFLCALSGGELIQDVDGHEKSHQLVLPDKYKRLSFQTTSSHHQVMNPYVLPRNEWLSFGHAAESTGSHHNDGNGKRIKVYKKWKEWKDQEIIWFKRTRCLSIQGHPEYYKTDESQFVTYCRFLIDFLILREKVANDKIHTP
jgi:GMP synthase-like glutamine amidotransferase